MGDRHRLLVLDELEQLRAGARGEWSGRAVGGLARILTRRHHEQWDEIALDLLAGTGANPCDEGRRDIIAWVLDWLRVVAATPPIVAAARSVMQAKEAAMRYDFTSMAAHTVAATLGYCAQHETVRVRAGWVDHATLEHVERLVDLALAWTERVREARRGVDRLMRPTDALGRLSRMTGAGDLWRARDPAITWIEVDE
jgi:hypothetical protein